MDKLTCYGCGRPMYCIEHIIGHTDVIDTWLCRTCWAKAMSVESLKGITHQIHWFRKPDKEVVHG